MDGGWMGVKGRGQRGGGTRGSPHWQKERKKLRAVLRAPGARGRRARGHGSRPVTGHGTSAHLFQCLDDLERPGPRCGKPQDDVALHRVEHRRRHALIDPRAGFFADNRPPGRGPGSVPGAPSVHAGPSSPFDAMDWSNTSTHWEGTPRTVCPAQCPRIGQSDDVMGEKYYAGHFAKPLFMNWSLHVCS